ncbi:cysteine desulfurase NifS [bacterium]|nr:cysteine desulfurase NifS [bacterium]
MTNIIYLDNNATTKVDERVAEKMLPYFCKYYGNPSSMHDFGGNVKHAVDEARAQIAEFMGANTEREIIFTGSGSESANLAVKGVLEAKKGRKHIITTRVEHACVLNQYKLLEKEGYVVDYIDVLPSGELDLSKLESMVNDDTALVSCMMANNETGVIFPVDKVAQIVKKKNHRTKVFVDAVQAAGKIKLDVKNTEIDMMSISGHKFHAPKGVGALYIKAGTLISPLIIGGHQEKGKRAGTEAVPSLVGFGYAAQLAQENLEYEATEVKKMRDALEQNIIKSVYNARINTNTDFRVPNTTNIGFQFIEGELILLHLSELGICASSGSACTSGSLEPSHVLKAQGIPFSALHGSIRFSLSRFNTMKEIDEVSSVLPKVIEKLNNISPFQKELKDLRAKSLIVR